MLPLSPWLLSRRGVWRDFLMAHKDKQINVRIPAELLKRVKLLETQDNSTTKKVTAAIRFALANGWPG